MGNTPCFALLYPKYLCKALLHAPVQASQEHILSLTLFPMKITQSSLQGPFFLVWGRGNQYNQGTS